MTESALTEGRLDVPVADLPQVAELDLNPVIARPDGVRVVRERLRQAFDAVFLARGHVAAKCAFRASKPPWKTSVAKKFSQ